MTQQVVIHWGGIGSFSVSHVAFLRLRELGNAAAFDEPDYGECWKGTEHVRVPFHPDERGSFGMFIGRSDPHLLQVLDELGTVAWGDSVRGMLEVVEIPDDVKWHIDCSDSPSGWEYVCENYRVWNPDKTYVRGDDG